MTEKQKRGTIPDNCKLNMVPDSPDIRDWIS